MKLSKDQIDILSKYFADLSKILVASTVIGFFAPVGEILITIPVFIGGFLTALGFLVFSIVILR